MMAIAGVHRRMVAALTTIACVSLYLQLSFLDSCVNSNVLENIAKSKKKIATGQNQLLFENHTHGSDVSSVPGKPEPVAHQNHRARILLGIFTADFREERRYRKKLRDLFQLHPRVCTLTDFTAADSLHASSLSSSCEIIYTFVAGGNPNGPSELVDGSLPMLAGRPVASHSTDFNDSDMTLLNIRENMNQGKSQTWLKYAAQILEAYDIDYVAKSDTDTLLFLDKMTDFMDENLPPAPYNRNILAGSVADKWWWEQALHSPEKEASEGYFIEKYGKDLHLYVEGQIYIMSRDLADFVAKEAAQHTLSYREGHEDHDISAMAFHSSKPIKLIIIALEQRFWQHRVKLKLGSNFHRIWDSEIARMSNLLSGGQADV
jgi:hypothetical protein